MTRSRPRRPSPAAVRWALDLIPPKREETKAVSSDATEIEPLVDLLTGKPPLAYSTWGRLRQDRDQLAAENAALRERAKALAGLLREQRDWHAAAGSVEATIRLVWPYRQEVQAMHAVHVALIDAALAATPGSGEAV